MWPESFKWGAEGGYWLTFECKLLAVLGRNRLGQPLYISDTILPLHLPVGQEPEALALLQKGI